MEPKQATLTTMNNNQRNSLEAQTKKKTNERLLIQSSVEHTNFPKIIGATSAKESWDTLDLAYQGNEKVKTVQIRTPRRECEKLKMK
jgi:hypothetical protein